MFRFELINGLLVHNHTVQIMWKVWIKNIEQITKSDQNNIYNI